MNPLSIRYAYKSCMEYVYKNLYGTNYSRMDQVKFMEDSL